MRLVHLVLPSWPAGGHFEIAHGSMPRCPCPAAPLPRCSSASAQLLRQLLSNDQAPQLSSICPADIVGHKINNFRKFKSDPALRQPWQPFYNLAWLATVRVQWSLTVVVRSVGKTICLSIYFLFKPTIVNYRTYYRPSSRLS